MKTWKLEQFATEGALNEAVDGEFIRKKTGAEDCFDFSGVTQVSPAFISALLVGETAETVADRISGASPKVQAAIDAWAEQQSVPKTSGGKPKKAPKKPPPPTTAALEFEAPPEPEGARYTPTRLVSRLRAQLQSYIESAYPLSDPALVRARRQLLEQEQNGRLLAQEPLVETTPRYRPFKGGYSDLGLPGDLAAFLGQLSKTPQTHQPEGDGPTKTILYPGMYEHQAQSFREFLTNGKDLIIATGTGSGKTECFLVPVLSQLFTESTKRKGSFRRPGARVLILYPMNALVNDQLARLRLLFGDPATAAAFRAAGADRHPTFGMYTGRTAYPGPRNGKRDAERVEPLLTYYAGLAHDMRSKLQSLGRYPAKDLDAFLNKDVETSAKYKGKGAKANKEYTKHNWKDRLHTSPGDRELLTRHEMVNGSGSLPGHAPDILVTNYSMLEYMLLRPFERAIFEETADWLRQPGNEFLVVLDEAHMYRGAQGAEVGFLLRRLQARLGIHDKPEKLRIICTSASLGSGADAKSNALLFAADLTGKEPQGFVAVTGQREVPGAGTPGTHEVASALASIDLEALHAGATAGAFHDAVVPVLRALGRPTPKLKTIEGVSKDLKVALTGQGFVNLLLERTSSKAQRLGALAEKIFPGHPQATRAVEVLLTLGALAKDGPDEGGLIPTRVHAFFRGLNALYACVNNACTGAREPGVLGRLFTSPRTHCDSCGGRVFELLSCRGCGTPYLLAYAEDPVASARFLWGETEGSLQRLQLLPIQPRYTEGLETAVLHIRTGFLEGAVGAPGTREIWFQTDADNMREAEFKRCAQCQPPESRTRSKIFDFRTRGEQPFTALIDAQFSEQPPQKADKDLPNRGRKVLVFSDGRQKAARLAPALETSHARDVFRQVLALAMQALTEQWSAKKPSLAGSYPAALWVCRQRGIDLFPGKEETIFHGHYALAAGQSLEQLIELHNQSMLQPPLSFAKQLFEEIVDKYFSLAALGLGCLELDPLLGFHLQDFPSIGVDPDEVPSLLGVWLRAQAEGNCFLLPTADIRALTDGWDGPNGIDPRDDGTLLRRPFDRFVLNVFSPRQATELTAWLRTFLGRGVLRQMDDRYYLQPAGLVFRPRVGGDVLVCYRCGKLFNAAFRNRCHSCAEQLESANRDYLDARAGYYRAKVFRAFQGKGMEPFGLTTAEHSAQLNGMDGDEAFSRTERYELRFQDMRVEGEPPIDVLSCTTTMEVGIDIGTLSGVALRNVPPHVSNYQQRAGRAGRRGRSVASVVTYAHGSTHDAYFYESPEKIVSGDVQPPVVYIENQEVLRRHVHAYVVQRFFHETVPADSAAFRLFESLGTVEQFLSEEHPCCLSKLLRWLKANETRLKAEITAWAPRRAHGLKEDIRSEVESTVESACSSLVERLNQVLPVQVFRQREQLEGPAREALEKVLSEPLLDTLLERAVFPRYAFPTDVVNLWVMKRRQRGDPAYKREFLYQPSRDLRIALSEYAPGRTLTIDKHRFTAAALYSPYESDVGRTLAEARSYVACVKCNYVSIDTDTSLIGACPSCRATDLRRHPFITPRGFAADVNEPLTPDKGEPQQHAGLTGRAQIVLHGSPSGWSSKLYGGRLELMAKQEKLIVVNKGMGDRGFMVCPRCGRTEPATGPGFTNAQLTKKGVPVPHPSPIAEGQQCDGKVHSEPLFLGHTFPTEIVLLRLNVASPVSCSVSDGPGHSPTAVRSALVTLVEALSLAASRVLQIDEGELAGNWAPAVEADARHAYVFLYDVLPGGAGYARQVRDRIEEILTEARVLLDNCDCETSCYRCLRNYENVLEHRSLDRHLALDLLNHIKKGDVPSVSSHRGPALLRSLGDVLTLLGHTVEVDAKRGNAVVPMVVPLGGGVEKWIGVHHPLVDDDLTGSALRDAAITALQTWASFDAHTLAHDLPHAVDMLGLPRGA